MVIVFAQGTIAYVLVCTLAVRLARGLAILTIVGMLFLRPTGFATACWATVS
jgi:hypothetical protein